MKVFGLFVIVIIATMVVSWALCGMAMTISSFDLTDTISLNKWMQDLQNEMDEFEYTKTFASVKDEVTPIGSMLKQINLASTEIANASINNIFTDKVHQMLNPMWYIIDNFYGKYTIFDFLGKQFDRLFGWLG